MYTLGYELFFKYLGLVIRASIWFTAYIFYPFRNYVANGSITEIGNRLGLYLITAIIYEIYIPPIVFLSC